MRNLLNFIKKPIPAIAIAATCILFLLKVCGAMSISIVTVFLPLIILGGIYIVLFLVILAAIIVQMIRLNKMAKKIKQDKK